MKWELQWAEMTALVVLVGSLFVALVSSSPTVTYVIALLAGSGFARILYQYKDDFQFPIFIIIAGCLIGFWVGGWFFVSKFWLTFWFFVGLIGVYKLHKKGLLKTIHS